MSLLSPLALLAYLLMFVGLIGSVLPLVPGPIFIWLGALLWAANDGFQAVGWPTLLFLGVLTILAWSSDLLLTTLFSRRGGASWKAILIDKRDLRVALRATRGYMVGVLASSALEAVLAAVMILVFVWQAFL